MRTHTAVISMSAKSVEVATIENQQQSTAGKGAAAARAMVEISRTEHSLGKWMGLNHFL